MKITTDLTGTESAATRHARIKAIYDWYFGNGAYVAAGNLGVARAALNGLLTSDIANGESFASWLVKMNSLNDLDTAIPALIFAGGYKGIVIDPEVLSSMSQDTAGATPVTAAGQPVGRILDRSGNAVHPVQATAAQKPTYRLDGSSRPQLRFDGVDDGMVTPSITWGTDEVTVVAAMRKSSDASTGVLLEMSAVIDTNAGAFNVRAPGEAGANSYAGASRGSSAPVLIGTGAVAAAPDTAVVTLMSKIATDTLTLRRNGVQVGPMSTDQGTGNFGSYPLYIGRRGGASLPLNGDIYGLLTVNKLLTTQERGWVEKWMALKSGVTLA